MRLFVAPNGSDQNTGLRAQNGPKTGDGPLLSLEGARDAIRRLQNRATTPRQSAVVEFAAGTYPFARPVVFDGREIGPLTFCAAQGARVSFSGGQNLTGWQKVTDADVLARWMPEARENVRMVNLKAQNVSDFGRLQARRTGGPERTPEAALELFFDGKPMTLARWPNKDWEHISFLPDDGKSGVFGFDDPRMARWKDEPDLWAHGYWFWDWADSHEKIVGLDAEKKTISLASGTFKRGQRFYIENALCELNSPGEWYLDRAKGILYFWPPRLLENGGAVVSLSSNLITCQNASNMTFEGFTLENVRGAAVRVKGGNGITFKRCLVRNVGTNGFEIDGGQNHTVRDCEITQTGEGAITMTGGDRATLTPANFLVENNHIHGWSYWIRCYRSAVRMIGVGMHVRHNKIHDAPHNAIAVGGNDNTVEYNEIYDVAKETGDVGAYYLGFDWTSVGNTICYNSFHDIKGPGAYGSRGIYLDGPIGGTLIQGNFFRNVNNAIFTGGGRHNLVDNNVFVNCAPAIFMDQTQTPDTVEKGLKPYALKTPYQNAIWRQKYPYLANFFEDEPWLAKYNVWSRNISTGALYWAMFPQRDQDLQNQTNNYVQDFDFKGDPGFVDAKNGDFRLKSDAGARKKGIETLPFDQMGLEDPGALPK